MNKLDKNTVLTYNSEFLMKDGEPWFPIMGEIHYSRYPEKYWKESLYKMKSGGVDTISTYVIWIHHEEIEHEYDFSGRKNLRAFLQTVKECGLYMMLRIGPWCHGEVRNGGFPDWLLQKEFEVRTNDKHYLDRVKEFYKRIYQEAQGYLIKDGGPVIGVQIENEYGHCGGLNGEDGEEHMRTLAELAKEVGFDVPLYTATGWGGAATGGLLPVMGGYCEAPWDQRLTEIEPSGNYIFTEERNDHNIGSDFGFGEGITYDIDKFPFLTAELGGGLQVTKHRRPIANARDIGAMSLVKLGSGVNLLGYYMYHGGTNPKGRLTSLQESRETGDLNDLPELSYDFNAPIKEYGQISGIYKEIKLLSMFLKDFGSELCEMSVHIPESNPQYQTDFMNLRTSVRRKGKNGYLFVNNFQRKCEMEEHRNESLKVELEGEVVTYPTIDIQNGDYFFFPFHMPIGNEAEIYTALATPLCKIQQNDDTTYVFYSNIDPKYEIRGELRNNHILTITREEALNSWKYEVAGRDYLFISDSPIICENDNIVMLARNRKGSAPISFKTYPELPVVPEHFVQKEQEGKFFVYENRRTDQSNLDVARVNIELLEDIRDEKKYSLTIDGFEQTDINDCFMVVSYRGESGELFINGEKEADDFYTGQTWEIGLKRFQYPEKMVLTIHQLEKNTPLFLDHWPKMEESKDSVCIIDNVELQQEIRYELLNF